jgi:WD40 repeat protein
VVASTWQAIRATVAEKAARSSERAAGLSEQLAQKRQQEAEEAKRLAEYAKKLAESRRDELAIVNDTLRRANYVADMNVARVAWDENNLTRAHELLEKHRPRRGETDLRGVEWHYLRRRFQSDLLTVKAHLGAVSAVAFMPDGKRLVTVGWSRPWYNRSDQVSSDVKLWDAATGESLPFPKNGAADKVARAALSPDGTHLAATDGSGNPTVLVWDLATGELVTLEGPEKHTASRVAFSPNGKRLVCRYRLDDDAPAKDPSGSIRIWDLPTHQAVVTIGRLSYWTGWALSFSPDAKLLATVDRDIGLVKVWDATTGREAFSCNFTDGGIVWDAAFSPDGKRLAACSSKLIRIWDVASRATQATWPSDSKGNPYMAFSPDGNRLAVGGSEGLAELWDTATGQKVESFKGHLGRVSAIAFSPDGARLATGGADGTLRLWDATARRDSVSVPKEDGASTGEGPQLSLDGQTLLTGHESGVGRRLQLWDTATGQPRCGPIELPQALVSRPAWSADGRHLYVADAGKTVRILDVGSGKVVRKFPIDTDAQTSLYSQSLDAGERWCAHSGPNGTIQVRDARTGALFRTLREFDGSVSVLVFSPDGSRLLAAAWDEALKIWDIATGREIAATKLTGVRIFCARFSPDGNRVAVVGNIRPLITGEVRILDAETAREILSLKGHATSVNDVAFSPDGHRLATCGWDETVRIWDLTAGQEILKLVESDRVDSVRFVSDGRRLITATRDRRIRVWDATPLPE